MQEHSGLALVAPTPDADIEREIDEDARAAKKRAEAPPSRTPRPATRKREGKRKRTRRENALQPEVHEVPKERTKNFSSVRSDVVRDIREFATTWRARYPRENPPKTKWLVSTILTGFLEGDATARIATRRLANLEKTCESPRSGAQEQKQDFSFRASPELIERIDEVVREWNVDDAAPKVSHAWILEAAYSAFLGESGDLVASAAEALAATFRNRTGRE